MNPKRSRAGKRRRTIGPKGPAPALIESRILLTVRHYSSLMVRQVFYILVSRFGYERPRIFYKLLDCHFKDLSDFFVQAALR